MQATAKSQLMTFNNLALRYQDEAYTLAYYLSGDERRAAEVTENAFARLFRRASSRMGEFRLEVLRWVLTSSRKGWRKAAHPRSSDSLIARLMELSDDERSAAILVDVLGLDYDDTARVLGCSNKQVGRLLAQARIKMARGSELVH